VLPVDALRPRWSSGSALVYIGAFVVLVGTGVLLGIVADDHGEAALVGASLVASVSSVLLALLLQARAHPVAAGVFATLAVFFFALLLGSLESWIGILEAETDDYQPAALLVEAGTVAASLAALQRFRAPLLILPVALTVWVTVTDIGSLLSTSRAEEILSLLVGVALAAAGVVVDREGYRPYGFWLHFVAGVAFGGGVLALVDGDGGWTLVGLLSLAYIAVGSWLGRASYAVLGAIGILATTTYVTLDSFSFVGAFLPFGVGDGEGIDAWQATTYYVVAGLVLVGLGLLDERFTARLRPDEPADV
jgi:hypothetical protein